jgi:hypothetical protein
MDEVIMALNASQMCHCQTIAIIATGVLLLARL